MLKPVFSFTSRPAALLALRLGLAPAALGQAPFAPAINYGVGTRPLSVVVGDFNGDGNPDGGACLLLAAATGQKVCCPSHPTPRSGDRAGASGVGRVRVRVRGS